MSLRKLSIGKMREKVLIGSSAVNFHDESILNRKSKDKDYLAFSVIPGEGVDTVDGAGILDAYDFKADVASLDEIYSLKVSHSPWVITSASWGKHLNDIHALKLAGAKLIQELHDLAYKQWEIRKGKKNVNLNQDKEEFFNGGVRRIYVHDSIHAAVAFNENPLYMKILADNEEVLTSRQKFFALSEVEKKQLVQEEVMVLSLERDLIPSVDPVDKLALYSSYGKQLKLLITQLSKGYFPRWIIENYFLVAKPPHDYWNVFSESDKKILI